MKLIYKDPIIKFSEREVDAVRTVADWLDRMSDEEFYAIGNQFGRDAFETMGRLLSDFNEFVFANMEEPNE
jgi:hypothetical protein